MELDAMLALRPGWDSYDALPISARTVEKAKQVLTYLPPGKWQCVPVADGGIQIEQHADDFVIEVYIHGELC